MVTALALQFGGLVDPIILEPFTDESGIPVMPVTANLKIHYQNGTGFSLLSTPTIHADTGAVTYSWGVAESGILAEALPLLYMRARWLITDAGSNVFEFTQFFNVVAVNIKTGITEYDLLTIWPILKDRRDTRMGRATMNGTMTVATDTDSRHELSNYWKGARVEWVTGGNRGQSRNVTQFDGIDSQITMSPALGLAVEQGDHFQLFTSYQPIIDLAFCDLSARLTEDLGVQASTRYVDGADIRQAHLYLSLIYAAQQRLQDAEAQAAIMRFTSLYEGAYSRARIKFESAISNSDGVWSEGSDDMGLPLRIWGK